MSTTTTAVTRRSTEAICPSWCAGHDETYQAWDLDSNGTRTRLHAEDGVSIGGVFVAAVVEEDASTGLGAPRVQVGDNSPGMLGSSELSDADAHRLGMAIARATDLVRHFTAARTHVIDIVGPSDDERVRYGCPEWCRRLDHVVDLVDDMNPPTHYGPMFGHVGVQMTAGARSEAVFYAGDDTIYLYDPARLRSLAADMIAAAEWLEVQQ